MKRIGKFLTVFFISLITTVSVFAQIRTTVSQDQVVVGDVFTVSIEVTFKDGAQPQLSIFEIPKDQKISFLQQSEGYSYQTTITNGVAQSKKTVTMNMVFYAKEKGIVKVPLVKLKINEKVFAAKGFTVSVVDRGTAPQANSSRRGSKNPMSGMESLLKEFFGQDNPRNLGTRDVRDTNVDFYIDVETSTMSPYFSEQFVANWYLYTNGRVTDIDTLKYPSLEGFWKDEISLATSLIAEPVEKNGKVFTRYLLASYALTPIVPNQVFIDPYEVKCQLVGGIFSFGTKEFVRKSDEVLIKVKPLPEKRPENFTGAVGEYQVSSVISDKSFKVGQPFNYTVRVSGEGQLKFMELPDLGLDPESFQIYDMTEDSQFHPPRRSVKTYKFLIVPKKVGELIVPKLDLAFFDPAKANFYTMSTRPIRLNVKEGDEVQQDIVSVYDEAKKQVYEPELYNKLSSSVLPVFNISGIAAYILCLFSFLISLSLVVFGYFGSRIIYDFNKDLRQRFKHLESLIENNQWREASTIAVNIVYFYANSKSKRKPKSQSIEDILSVLPVGLRREIEDSLRSLNTDLQRYSFAPESLLQNSDVKAKVLEKCLALKELLESSSKDESKN